MLDMKNKSSFVPRVNQLDAIQLDNELLRLFREQYLFPIQNYAPAFYVKYQLELDLILRAAIWSCCIRRSCSTFGQEMLLISYDKTQLTYSRLCLHFVLTIMPQYIKNSSEQKFIRYEWLSHAVSVAEKTSLFLSIANFFRFLKTGKNPSLIDFILGLNHISIEGSKHRDIGYKYMTRELLWGGFLELVGLVLPLINYRKMRRIVKNVFSQSKVQRESIKAVFTINSLCICCNNRPTLPHHMGCGHIACYYCVQGNLLTDSEFACPECNCKRLEITQV